MKVLFVQPADRAGSVRLGGKVYMSQLTLPTLAALVGPEHEVRLVDENVDPIDYDWPDVAGITAMTQTAPRAYRVAAEFRRRGKKVVLGGVHPSLLPEEALEHADAVVSGEAEGLIDTVLDDVAAGRSRGVYRLEKWPSLAGLPMPRHDLVNASAYNDIPRVETSRGCPFHCSFCSTTAMFGHLMRYRPVEEVVAEIRAIGARFVFFTDNNIVGNPKYARALFEALTPLRIAWLSQGSLNLAHDPDLLALAARSGCIGMLVGFESLGDATIAALGKKVNHVEQYESDVAALHRHGIGLIGCFVFGFDEDDASTIERTVAFVERVNIDVPQLTVLTPYPGTVLRTQLEQAGRILHSRWEEYDIGHVVFQPARMSVEELQAAYRSACARLYAWPRMVKRVLRSSLYLRSPGKTHAFWLINRVYRKLFELTLDETAGVQGFRPRFATVG